MKTLTEVENQIFCGDVLEKLSEIPDDCVSLVFTSPPYNVDIEYGSHKDNMPWDEYLTWMSKVFKECSRVLRTGGRLAINFDLISNRDHDTEYFRPMHAELINMMRSIPDMMFRSEVMWCKAKENPLHSQVVGRATAWGSFCSPSNPVIMRNHEYIMIWSKKQWQLEGDVEQSDLGTKEFMELTRSVWCVPAETKNKRGHPVPFPMGLATRVIKLLTYRGDLVLDPFNGTGTTTASAAALSRRYLGIDIDSNYCSTALERTLAEKNKINETVEPYTPRSVRLAAEAANKSKKVEETDLAEI